MSDNLRTRLLLMPDREWWRLHVGCNVIGSTALFVAFWWTLPTWALVPYAAFWGAAVMNSLTAWLVRRDLRALDDVDFSGGR
jgi:hypothetical protein